MARITQEFSEVAIEQDSVSVMSQSVGEVAITQDAKSNISTMLIENFLNIQQVANISNMLIEVVFIPKPIVEYEIWPQERIIRNINIQGQRLKI